MSHPLHIIILAAGDGTRMKSRLPKVLHPVGGKPMLSRVLDTARSLRPESIHVVHNPAHTALREALDGAGINWVEQRERLGTGHAVQQAMPGIPDAARVLVLYGDTPLVPGTLLGELLALDSPLALLFMTLQEPRGYGRVRRSADGQISGIVEERDANAGERAIREVNSGILAADAKALAGWLGRLGRANSQGEYYLTDVFGLAAEDGVQIGGVSAPDASLLQGVNDRRQQAALESRWREIEVERLQLAGVSIADPARIDIQADVEAGSDVSLGVNVSLSGQVRLGTGVQIGTGCVLRDCDLAPGTQVHPYSLLEGVTTLGACEIGPFARLRPGTELHAGSKVGNFVEVKNTRLGEGSKASHLSYLGDSEIGSDVNIGAGTITCNYDGVNKHRTVIGDGAFIGSDTQLVAPVTVGAGATIGAGSTITRDAPPGELTISRAKQLTVRGWKRPARKGPH